MSCYLDLKTKKIDITKEKNILLEELKELFDEDFNGNNGEEYTSEEAKAEGYQSDLSHAFDLLMNKEGLNPFSSITRYSNVIQKLIDMNYSDSYYKDYKCDIEVLNENQLFISIACIY